MILPWWWRWAALAAVLLASFGTGYLKGWHSGNERLEAYMGRQAVEGARLLQARTALTERIVTRYVKVQGQTQVVTKEIEREVTRYAETHSSLRLDADWRRLHDAAALNAVPGSTCGTDGSCGDVTAAAALQTVTANYAACIRTGDRLTALQSWVREQRAVR